MQALGGGELQVVFEQVVEAFAALQFDGDQRRLPHDFWNSGAAGGERVRLLEQVRGNPQCGCV